MIAEAARLRRELERLRAAESSRRIRRRIGRLEERIESLGAEDHRLRLAIDRTAPSYGRHPADRPTDRAVRPYPATLVTSTFERSLTIERE